MEDGPCSQQFTTIEFLERRQEVFQLSAAEKDMLLLGVVSAVTDTTPVLTTWKKGPQVKGDRQHQRSYYKIGNKTVCRDTFKFMYA